MSMKYAAVLSGMLLGSLAAQAQVIGLFTARFDGFNVQGVGTPGAGIQSWALTYANSEYIANAVGTITWGPNSLLDEDTRPALGGLLPSDAIQFIGRNNENPSGGAWQIEFDVVKNFIPQVITYFTSQSNPQVFPVTEAWRVKIGTGAFSDWVLYDRSTLDLGNGQWDIASLPIPNPPVLLKDQHVTIQTVITQIGDESGTKSVSYDNISLFGVVPEPSTYAMFFGLGLAGFAAYRRMRQA